MVSRSFICAALLVAGLCSVVAGYPAPVADFAANVTGGVAPLTIEFGPTLLDYTVHNGWYWAENESGLEYTYGSEDDPYYFRVVFDNPGVYDVGMKAIGPGGTVWVNKTDYITVYAPADINRNGRADFADIVLFFNALGIMPYTDDLDFNENGRMDFGDVVALFARI